MTEKKTTYSILCWNTALSELKGGENKDKIDKIFDYISAYLNSNDNPIVILQQIPYKVCEKNKPCKYWKESQIHEDYYKRFQGNGYTIKENKAYNVVMMTSSIIKDTLIPNYGNDDEALEKEKKKLETYYPDRISKNRVILLKVYDELAAKYKKYEDEYCKLSILGLHVKAGNENLSYLENINGEADIILGDFNAGNYDEERGNKNAFCKLLSATHVCIVNTPTKEVWNKNGKFVRKTCIDHVFIKRKYVTNISNLIVHEDIIFSDHYPITFKITV